MPFGLAPPLAGMRINNYACARERTSHAFQGVAVLCGQVADSCQYKATRSTMSDREFRIVLEQIPGREVGLNVQLSKL